MRAADCVLSKAGGLTVTEALACSLDRIANRLAVSVLAAAFIMALAWLMPAMDLTWPWGVATWFVVVTFVTASLLGLWLLWNIWRSR